MSAIPSAYERMDNGCLAFHWIGQTFASCNECGKPFWEHSHDARSVGGPFSDRWRRVVISRQAAEYCRARWGA